ncbi:LysR family transcriptional regulator [Sulfitobacter donghicola]|uniref:LysR family transcriptional regulator n=1 Tax=Sulfitobacter donghicola DSW-25 = KCTC 12864 = JCM 14565 TaxID=1300350 RepID=A0A073IKN5_9RHOB|nr:LysR family transcriptional regulator [Sulfitobacter donghicola]KEJ90130.1 LysR family transcriptional regulator [Sulfitobacter donghicola DSW-25 = KCTC 12864 = JCM 14565]KIN66715.1 Transcriptional regulator, LysR family [Sulfitobacter donghicola DSW-25 = KCTC 12864 = JCM 14565]
MIKSQITLKQLEAFAFVVDTGTFRAAAAALGTTQPNISARIAALESTLNVVLLIRDSGSVRLTAKGEKLLQKARDVLWAGEALLEEAARQDLIEETLRLGVTELVACTWLQDFLRLIKEAYPNLRIQLEVDISTAIDARLMEGQLDLALQTEPFKSASFASEPLGQEAYCWVASAELSSALDAAAGIEELFDATILTHAKHTQACASLHQMAADRGLPRDRIVHSSALSACLPMVLEGMGVGMLPERLVEREIATGKLYQIQTGWLPDPLSFYARYAQSRAGLYVKKAAQLASLAMNARAINKID